MTTFCCSKILFSNVQIRIQVQVDCGGGKN
uniref:Uncharacterized protein n=1 Tax=Anguilla anguilla TaxID=7936 RepID=A0A0E9XSY1_ANGAN